MTVVKAVTTSSTNITGFLISVRGLSLTKAEPIAGSTILGSVSAVTGIRLRKRDVSIAITPSVRLEQLTRNHGQGLNDWSKCQGREEGETTHDHDHTHDQADKQSAIGGKGAGRR